MMLSLRKTTTRNSVLLAQRGLAYRKHPRTGDKREVIQKYRAINAAHEAAATASGLPWRYAAATILHRYPTILVMPEDWEIENVKMQEKIGAKRREVMMETVGGTPAQIIPEKNTPYEDILASMPFQPASRITEADEADDRKSLERKLDQSLYLIVKRNRADNAWQFPQGKFLANETFRASAERVIDRSTGSVDRWFISNAPAGNYWYRYPDAVRDQRKQFGAKIFYSRCQYLGGPLKLETRLYKDFAWIAREELDEYFNAETADYLRYILPLDR